MGQLGRKEKPMMRLELPLERLSELLAYSNAGVSKVECPECATTRSLDGSLGDSTLPFPPKTKNEHLISEIRILKVLLLIVLIVTNEVQAPSMSNASKRQLAEENRSKEP